MAAQAAQAAAVWRRLGQRWSVELTPRMAARIVDKQQQQWRAERRAQDPDPEQAAAAALAAGLGDPPAGTRVYVTALPGSPLADNAALCAQLRAAGMKPVPHIAARDIRDEADLAHRLQTLAAAARGDECLLIAGSGSQPVGCFSDSMQVLRTGLLAQHGFTTVGVAGHPEGAPGIADSVLDGALQWKNEHSEALGIDMYIMTQLVFDVAPIVRWLDRISGQGPGSALHNQLPVRIGLAGPASARQLLKYGALLGVGPSLQLLSRNSSKVGSLLTQSSPDPLIEQLVQAIAASSSSSGLSLIQGLHFYCFGDVASTTRGFRALCQRHGVEI